MNFTLDNGEHKNRQLTKRIISYRLSPWYTLESRKLAAESVTDPNSGHAGFTISALVREARASGLLRFKDKI